MTVNSWGLVLLSAGLTVGANLLLRIGIDRAGGFPGGGEELLSGLLRLVHQLPFDLGVVLYGLAALVWFRVIATAPLSTAYPALVSLTFIFVTLGAIILFHEPLTWRKIVGLPIIILGIFMISMK